MTDRYRLVGPKPITRTTGEDIERGQVFEPRESELRSFGDKLEPVEDETDDEDDGEASEDPVDEDEADQDDVEEAIAEGESGTLPLNPEDYTIAELEERLEDVDDEAALVALRNLEEEQEDRDGAKDAIDARLGEL